ncbi:bacillithiol system redox-active protein YtxJ [Gaetbulibacter saemankumensis]|uniref:bacillithiol system redox-active protein YtxJ n=1 Tax=Gaetbulibacter saemankumensis TaxID=311208 RepID=UPI000401ED6B|nr:bacillithiol system redox-active protein YtxJ [Gaetbulibacter saemankumensis]
MRLISKLFNSVSEEKEEKVLPWNSLNKMEALEEIENKSKEKTQVIFKHSTRCGISRMVINRFVESYNLNAEQADLYYLDLLNYRDISNEIASKFQVWHESPQLLVIKNGTVMKHASHSSINELDLTQL